MRLNPYLSFADNCEEAFTRYAEILGGEITMIMRWKDAPGDYATPPERAELVMHATLKFGDNVLMGSDQPPQYFEAHKGCYLSLQLDAPEEADRMFEALSEGGQVMTPIAKTFWARRFGMLTDRFGAIWMINCE